VVHDVVDREHAERVEVARLADVEVVGDAPRARAFEAGQVLGANHATMRSISAAARSAALGAALGSSGSTP
jgi:hypothetical protein